MKNWVRLMLVMGLVLGTATVAMAQGGGRGGLGWLGGFQGGRGRLAWLQDENVRKDLGVTADQMKKVEEFQAESRETMGQDFLELRDLTPEERTVKIQELQKKYVEANAAAEKEILLPKQIDRLKQISIQSRFTLSGTAAALAGDELAKELGITDAQKVALKKAQEEAEAELQEKTAKLREEARQKILSVLAADQQSKLKSLLGEKFQFSRGRPGGVPPARPLQGN